MPVETMKTINVSFFLGITRSGHINAQQIISIMKKIYFILFGVFLFLIPPSCSSDGDEIIETHQTPVSTKGPYYLDNYVETQFNSLIDFGIAGELKSTEMIFYDSQWDDNNGSPAIGDANTKHSLSFNEKGYLTYHGEYSLSNTDKYRESSYRYDERNRIASVIGTDLTLSIPSYSKYIYSFDEIKRTVTMVEYLSSDNHATYTPSSKTVYQMKNDGSIDYESFTQYKIEENSMARNVKSFSAPANQVSFNIVKKDNKGYWTECYIKEEGTSIAARPTNSSVSSYIKRTNQYW